MSIVFLNHIFRFYSRTGASNDRKKLFLRNPIRLDDVPIDDSNAIVFVLEYMVSVPLGAPLKPVCAMLQ